LHVWPVTRSVTRFLTSDVSVVPFRLRRNAELRFVGHIATGRDPWDAVAGSKPSGRTWDLGSQVSEWHPVVGRIGAAGGIALSSSQVRDRLNLLIPGGDCCLALVGLLGRFAEHPRRR
jgi:hypothetical protein